MFLALKVFHQFCKDSLTKLVLSVVPLPLYSKQATATPLLVRHRPDAGGSLSLDGSGNDTLLARHQMVLRRQASQVRSNKRVIQYSDSTNKSQTRG